MTTNSESRKETKTQWGTGAFIIGLIIAGILSPIVGFWSSSVMLGIAVAIGGITLAGSGFLVALKNI